MSLTYSQEPKIGMKAPGFSLASVEGQHYEFKDFNNSKALLVAFICGHCPYVQAIEDRLIALAKAYAVSDLQIVGICANDATRYAEDKPTELLKRWQRKKYGFPYLIDETQEIAKAYGAVCTPDLFVYDNKRTLYYHGRVDDNWKDETRVTKHELREAIDTLLAGLPPPSTQHPSMGCSIKWR